jgi:hypothetical protein
MTDAGAAECATGSSTPSLSLRSCEQRDTQVSLTTRYSAGSIATNPIVVFPPAIGGAGLTE